MRAFAPHGSNQQNETQLVNDLSFASCCAEPSAMSEGQSKRARRSSRSTENQHEAAAPSSAMTTTLPSLLAAVEQADRSAIQRLAAAKADLNEVDEETGASALLVAASSKPAPTAAATADTSASMLEALLQAKASANAVHPQRRTTAFMMACKNGAEAYVRLLVDAKTVLHHCNEHGATALHVACEAGNVKVVEKLLELGLPASAETRNGVTPAQIAKHFGHAGVVELVTAAAAAEAKLMSRIMVAIKKSPEALRDVIDEFAPKSDTLRHVVDESNTAIRVLLHPCAGAPTVLHYVLGETSWDANALRRCGDVFAAALCWACTTAVVAVPEQARPFGTAMSIFQDNPLLHTAAAAINSHTLSVVEFLCRDCGADINTTAACEFGGTCVFAAIRNARLGDGRHGPSDNRATACADANVVCALIDSLGANVEAQDTRGATPLFIAVVCNALEIARALLKKGTDSTISLSMMHAFSCNTEFANNLDRASYLDDPANAGALDGLGQQPIHVVKSDEMKSLLEEAMGRQGVELAAVPDVSNNEKCAMQ